MTPLTAVSSGLADAIKSSLNKLATQGLALATSPLSNLFGSLISSNVSPQQRVNLSPRKTACIFD